MKVEAKNLFDNVLFLFYLIIVFAFFKIANWLIDKKDMFETILVLYYFFVLFHHMGPKIL